MKNWENITYPAPLRPGDAIGVTALSDGVSERLHPRLDLCIGHLKELGYEVREGQCLRESKKYVSGRREERVADLLSLWRMEDVKAILPPWGGELLVHILPCIDFELLAESTPKWILGYSDTSTLLFALTLRTGIATAHGTTLMEMIPNQSGVLSQKWQDVLSLKQGESLAFSCSSKFQIKSADWGEDPTIPFNLTEQTEWRCMAGNESVDGLEMRGRAIGGCLETLSSLIGTPYGDLGYFKDSFRDDGVILYLENAESKPGYVCRFLWNMRLAGWFDGLNGLLLGRWTNDCNARDFTYIDAVKDALVDTSIPVIYDVDIGHRPPQMTLVNGAITTVSCSNSKGKLTVTLK